MSQKVSFTPALIDRIGPIGRVLEDFLSQQARAVQAALEKKWPDISHSATKRVLNEFVSLEGTKKPQSVQEFQAFGVNEAQKLFLLQQLEKSRILTESDGIYEVAHDTLAKIIAEQRTDDEVALLEAVKLVKDRHQDHQKYNTLLSRKELAFLGRYEDRLREYEQLAPEEWAFVRESKRKATRNRWLLILALAALVAASLGVTYVIYKQKNEAQGQAEEAKRQQKIAEIERLKAELQKVIAIKEEMEADRQWQRAEEQTREAERQRGIAEQQKNEAERQKEIAERESLKSRYSILSAQSLRAQDDDNTLALQLAFAAHETVLAAEAQDIGLDEGEPARENAWNLFVDMAAQQNAPFYQARIDLNNKVSSLDVHNGEILIGGENGEVSIWTARGQGKKRLPTDKKSGVQSVVFSRDGNIATLSTKGEVVSWTQNGTQLPPFSNQFGPIRAIAFSNDGKYLLAGTGKSIIQHEVGTENFEDRKKGKQREIVNCIAFLPEGKHFLYAFDSVTQNKEYGYRIGIQSLEGRTNYSIDGHSNKITSLSVSPDGKYLVSGSWDNKAILWEIKASAAGELSLHKRHTLSGHKYNVNAVAFSPDGWHIATGSDDKTIMLWDLNGKMIQTFRGHSQEVTALRWLNEHSFASGSLDRTVKVWDITHLHRKMEHREGSQFYHGDVYRARFNGKGQAITATRSGNIYRWGLSGGQITTDSLGKMPPGGFNQITDFFLLPGKGQLVYSNKRGYIGLARLQKDTAIVTPLKAEEEEGIYKIGEGDCFTYLPLSPGKKSFLLVGLNEPMVKQYTFQGDSIVRSQVAFGPHPVDNPAMTAAYFPQSPKVVTASLKGKVYIWSTLDGSLLHQWEAQSLDEKDKGILSVAVSPNESCIATGARDNKLVVWDTKGKQIQSLDHGRPIRSIAFSKDGNLLLTGSIDNLARLYRLMDGEWQLVQRFEGHTNTVWSVSFSPDERQVITASLDNSARTWNIIDAEFMNSGMIAPLTQSQRRQYGLKD